MPILDPEQAKQVDEHESEDFEPIPAGTYDAILFDVKAVNSKGGDPMWKATFKITDEAFANRRVIDNMMLTGVANWKLKQFFDAFGTTADTNTDELLGKPCQLRLNEPTEAPDGRKFADLGSVLPSDGVLGDTEEEPW